MAYDDEDLFDDEFDFGDDDEDSDFEDSEVDEADSDVADSEVAEKPPAKPKRSNSRPAPPPKRGAPKKQPAAREEAPRDEPVEEAKQPEPEPEPEPVPAGPPADHVVHIYEFGKFKRTIPREFTDEDSIKFAEEFNRTSKSYGRHAVPAERDEEADPEL